MPKKPLPRRNLIVLGSTGTIGRLTLEVAARYPERLRVVGLGADRNASLLAAQAEAFSPNVVALADEEAVQQFRPPTWRGEILSGQSAASRLAAWPDVDVVINGIVGAAGLGPSLAALDAGRRLGLANKESMVMAGHLLREARNRSGGEILPIDSEHSALFQCLEGRDPDQVRQLILTASGGPFRTLSAEALARVTPDEALRHPTWKMGNRITVDSATLFNKGMELIEARWLFDLPLEKVQVLVHPQAMIHGMVELVDGSVIAQLSCPDMRLPIQLALSYPERWDEAVKPTDLAALGEMTFEAPDEERFPCLAIVRQAGQLGGVAPAVVNGADEVLVAAFLAGRIRFPAIAAGLGQILANGTNYPRVRRKRLVRHAG